MNEKLKLLEKVTEMYDIENLENSIRICIKKPAFIAFSESQVQDILETELSITIYHEHFTLTLFKNYPDIHCSVF